MSSFEVEINTEYRTAIRFPAWMVLTVFSAVSLVSIVARIKPDDRGSEEKWALAVTSLSMIVGFLGTAAYLFIRGIYVGQIPEAVMVSCLCVVCCCCCCFVIAIPLLGATYLLYDCAPHTSLLTYTSLYVPSFLYHSTIPSLIFLSFLLYPYQ